MEKSLKRGRNKSEQQHLKEQNNYVDAFNRIHRACQGAMYEFEDGGDIVTGHEMALDIQQYNDWELAQHNYHNPKYGQEGYSLFGVSTPSIQIPDPKLMEKVKALFKTPTHQKQYEILEMYYFQKLTEDEIAKRLDKQQNSINRSANRGIARIQKHLTETEWKSIQYVFKHMTKIEATKKIDEETLKHWNRHDELKRKPSNIQLAIHFMKDGQRKILNLGATAYDDCFGDGNGSYEWIETIDPNYDSTLLPIKPFDELPIGQYKQEFSTRGINPNGKTFYKPLEKVEVIENLITLNKQELLNFGT
ncbi:hypothetical protein [Bacillus sp. AFS017336]|uniref:hypothetical protein n=1 Tax=Bacillus sp. AFS017336 TaxID=2033489 RepID=UPI000BEF8C27|nr:hypothetical protein [Bacillus sp. AFS017336]PEL13019.1 hypothetical protein CN601_05900 [Bacillus sp. AFS017336]